MIKERMGHKRCLDEGKGMKSRWKKHVKMRGEGQGQKLWKG